MKKLILSLCVFVLSIISQYVLAQSQTQRELYAVLNIDVSGSGSLDKSQLGNILRRHLEKLDTFRVIDKYDMEYILSKESKTYENCYGKLCLAEVGKKIKADKVLSGTVDIVGDMIVITLRRVDIKSGEIDKTIVKEFLNLQIEIGFMLQITLNEFLGLDNPPSLVESLTKKDAFANSFNQAYAPRLAVDGPRFGFSFVTGETAKILGREEDQGGFNGYPMSFHFGYQFEKQYLNQGNFQALFEFIPLLTGLEQGRISGSLTLMNGIRHNRNGWEIAFGPSISTTQIANVTRDSDGKLITQKQWNELYPNTKPTDGFRKQIDSRGDVKLDPSFVFAFGKTIKSGNLNIPLNVFVIPKKDDFRFGISVGYNSSR